MALETPSHGIRSPLWSPPARGRGQLTCCNHFVELRPQVQGGAPKIAKLVFNSNNYGL